METLKTKGIILKSTDVGEADKIVKMLTPGCGVIDVSVRGGKKLRNQLSAPSQVFTFGDFVLGVGHSVYFLNQADIIEQFEELIYDAVKLTYAAHFAKLLLSVVQEGVEAAEELYLILQGLFEMVRGRMSDRLICRTFEMKLACIEGFAPNIEGTPAELTKLFGETPEEGTKKAFEFISSAASKNVFSFGVSDSVMEQMDRIVPGYIANCFESYSDVDDYLNSLHDGYLS